MLSSSQKLTQAVFKQDTTFGGQKQNRPPTLPNLCSFLYASQTACRLSEVDRLKQASAAKDWLLVSANKATFSSSAKWANVFASKPHGLAEIHAPEERGGNPRGGWGGEKYYVVPPPFKKKKYFSLKDSEPILHRINP